MLIYLCLPFLSCSYINSSFYLSFVLRDRFLHIEFLSRVHACSAGMEMLLVLAEEAVQWLADNSDRVLHSESGHNADDSTRVGAATRCVMTGAEDDSPCDDIIKEVTRMAAEQSSSLPPFRAPDAGPWKYTVGMTHTQPPHPPACIMMTS